MKSAFFTAGLLLLGSHAFAQMDCSSLRIVTPPNLPPGSAGRFYSQLLGVQSAGYQVSWSLAGGNLPAGLSLLPSGAVSGIPSGSGTSIFVASVSYPGFSCAAVSQTFTLSILAGAPSLTFTPATLPPGYVGELYARNFAVTGGVPPYVWSVSSGTLPDGLSLVPNTAGSTPSAAVWLQGDITGSAVTSTFTITVTDSTSAAASQEFTLAITPIQITTSSVLPMAGAGTPYSETLAVSGGTPPYSWSIGLGALPPGLSMSSDGAITGTATSNGTAVFEVTVTDANSATASATFTLSVGVLSLAISTASPLPAGTAGTSYAQTLTATGGVPPYVWQVTSGSLPPLLTLSTDGAISGTPTTPGLSTFSVTVTDSASHTASKSFTLAISSGQLTITSPATLPPAVSGVAYSQVLTASGGLAPYTWEIVSGSWPDGLSMSSAGAITGTPGATGTYVFSARVTDSAAGTATQTFGLTVAAVGTPTRAGVVSQVAAGGGWDTTIWLVNRNPGPIQIKIVFRGDEGSALTLPFTVTQAGVSKQVTASTIEETIAPNTTLVAATGAVSSSTQGWAEVLSSNALGGFAVFRYAGASEVTVPLISQSTSSFTMPFDQTGGYKTGVALVNLSGWQANLSVTVWDQYGNQILSQPFSLAQADGSGHGHDSFMLADRLPATAGTRGIVQFQSIQATPMLPPGTLTGVGLRASPGGFFTSLPIMTP